MQAVADALSLLANIVRAWKRHKCGQVIPAELIGKIAPTRLESINLRGVFRFRVDRYADQILPSAGVAMTVTDG